MICAVPQSTIGSRCRLDINPLMPRHRIEHEPRHRAPRADRRVQFSGAPSRSPSHAKPPTGSRQRGTAVERQRGTGVEAVSARTSELPRVPSHAKPPADTGQLGRAFEAIGSGASERLHTAGSRIRNEQRVLLTGAVRGLMVSPWFAAGAGFVIAAGAFMYAPHASLNFDTAPGLTVCPTLGCPVPQKEPQIAGGASGLVTASPSPSSSSPRGRHAAHDDSAAAPSFAYTVQADGSGMYQMVLTETSEQPIGSWQLSVVVPGATSVDFYDGVQQSGSNGATTGGGDSHGGADGAGPSPGLTAGVINESGNDPTTILRVVVDGEGSTKTVPENGWFKDAQGRFQLS